MVLNPAIGDAEVCNEWFSEWLYDNHRIRKVRIRWRGSGDGGTESIRESERLKGWNRRFIVSDRIRK